MMTRTYWLVFSDPDRPRGERFRGVVILDLPELDLTDMAAAVDVIGEAMIAVGLDLTDIHGNPDNGTLALHVDDVTESPFVPAMAQYKGRLLTDDALLLSIGSRGRDAAAMQ
jgi:hypothetical protein